MLWLNGRDADDRLHDVYKFPSRSGHDRTRKEHLSFLSSSAVLEGKGNKRAVFSEYGSPRHKVALKKGCGSVTSMYASYEYTVVSPIKKERSSAAKSPK